MNIINTVAAVPLLYTEMQENSVYLRARKSGLLVELFRQRLPKLSGTPVSTDQQHTL